MKKYHIKTIDSPRTICGRKLRRSLHAFSPYAGMRQIREDKMCITCLNKYNTDPKKY